jgi:hypothetical protein
MLTSLFDHIDLYCERLDSGLWAEPLNALSNLVLILAGLWGVREVSRRGTGGFALLLAWWVVAIGVGSLAFHTFANRLTIWGDIVPIAGFTLAYTLFNLRRFLRFSWRRSIAVFVVFYAAAGLITWLIPQEVHAFTNRTTGYLPALLALVFFGVWAWRAGSPAGAYNLVAAGMLIVSATFRSIDPEV